MALCSFGISAEASAPEILYLLVLPYIRKKLPRQKMQIS